MSSTILQHQSIAQMLSSLATIQELVSEYFNNKEKKEAFAKILFSQNIDSLRKNIIQINYDKFPEIKKDLMLTFETLKIEMIKSVTSVSKEKMNELQKEMNAFSYAIKYLYFKPKWVDRCLFRVERVYRECIAEDRQALDSKLLDQLTYSIKYIASVVKQIAFFERRIQSKEKAEEMIDID
ncbi:MAG: hypothetical protein ACTSRP_09070 [Candidatus Helarchaeota archaeon]